MQSPCTSVQQHKNWNWQKNSWAWRGRQKPPTKAAMAAMAAPTIALTPAVTDTATGFLVTASSSLTADGNLGITISNVAGATQRRWYVVH